MPARRISTIVPGERVRSDMGDIAALAESIRTVGLIQPIVVDTRGNLLAGARRLAACKRLGLDEVDVVEMRTNDDLLAALAIEEQENTCRRDFTPTEAARLRKKREVLLAAQAKERRLEGNRSGGKVGGKLPPTSGPAKTRDAASAGLKFSPRTLDKVDNVVEAATDDTLPEPVREIAKKAVAEIDATGKVDAAHKKVERAKAEHSPLKAVLDALLDQPDGRILTMRHNVSKGILRSHQTLLIWPTDQVAAALTEQGMTDLATHIADLSEWFKKVQAARPRGLRLVEEA